MLLVAANAVVANNANVRLRLKQCAEHISDLGRKGEWQAALHALWALPEQNLNANTVLVNVACQACKLSGEWSQALALCEHATAAGLQLDTITFSTVVSACAAEGQWIAALSALREMEAMSLPRNLVTYSAIISACAGEQWWRALAFLTELESQLCLPNVIVYNSVLRSCASGAGWLHVLDLLKHAIYHTVDVDRVSYSIVITGLGDVGAWTSATKLLDDMTSAGVQADVVAYNAALACIRGKAKWQDAAALMADVLSQALRPTAKTTGTILSTLQQPEGWQPAIALLLQTLTHGDAVNVPMLGAALRLLRSEQKWFSVLQHLGSTAAMYLRQNLVVMHDVLGAYDHEADWEGALSLATDYLSPRGFKPDVVTSNTVASVFDRVRSWEVGCCVLRTSRVGGRRPDVVTFSASVAAWCNQRHSAWRSVLSQACMMLVHEVEPDDVFWKSLVWSYTRASHWQSAVLSCLDPEGSQLPELRRQCVLAYAKYADGFGSLDVALACLGRLRRDLLEPDADILNTLLGRSSEWQNTLSLVPGRT
eukprot:TRINITY_DN21605_c0_g1_i1.p1 TRINITY_DN21605_c0_g1~~TRINITY_DN21605_c0_g1_i1.p1  ORF type:complete len:538 (-),score=49.53 TRINITY_DN21605_c0_g1_i1:301-1914(-)